MNYELCAGAGLQPVPFILKHHFILCVQEAFGNWSQTSSRNKLRLQTNILM